MKKGRKEGPASASVPPRKVSFFMPPDLRRRMKKHLADMEEAAERKGDPRPTQETLLCAALAEYLDGKGN